MKNGETIQVGHAKVTKLAFRTTHTSWDGPTKHRWQSSRTSYSVRYPSGRECPCDSLAEATVFAADETKAIERMRMGS